MSSKVNLRPQAAADLRNIWNYSADRWSREQANKYVRGLRQTMEMLSQMPHLGRELRGFTPPVRVHTSGQHVLIYEITDGAVWFIRVPASRQNWRALLQK